MSARPTEFYFVGGTVPNDAQSYVTRKADEDLLEGMREGQFCYVLTSRQMGKSSLLVRTMLRLRTEGISCAMLDLTAIGQNLTLEQWYDGLLTMIGWQFDLEDELEEYWATHQRLVPLQRFTRALREVVLERIEGPVALFIDEVDAVVSLPFSADEFFAGIRECYNRRAVDPAFDRLTFALFGVASPADLVRNVRTTPFNIGRRIELTDFTSAEAAPLAIGFELHDTPPQLASHRSSSALQILNRVLYWTGGHPYLTQRLCRAVARARVPDTIAIDSAADCALVDRLCLEMFLVPGACERDDNLLFVRNQMLNGELDPSALLTLYRNVQAGRRVRDAEADDHVIALKLAGIVRADSGWLSGRNRIYERVFDCKWIEANMPGAELRRQRAAFRRGVFQTTVIAALVVLVMATLATLAIRNANRADANAKMARHEKDRADQKADEADRNLYIANINLMRSDWEDGNLQRLRELLDMTRDRGEGTFEWGYWNRLSHLDLFTLHHASLVNTVAISQDGKRLFSANGGTVRVWDAVTGRELLQFQAHSGKIQTIVVSPDGKWLATGSDDGTAKVWSIQDRRLLRTIGKIGGDLGVIWCVVFSPDGTRLVTAGEKRRATVWSLQTGKLLLTLQSAGAAAFSPDGRRIVTNLNDCSARVWDARTGEQLLRLQGHTILVGAVAYSPDGHSILTGSWDTQAKIWNAQSGQFMMKLKDPKSAVLGFSFSKDGNRILTANYDGTAKVWDAKTGWEQFTLKGHSGRVTAALFYPDGQRIVTSSFDGTVRVWDARTDHACLNLAKNNGYAVAISRNGTHIVTGNNDHTVKVWDARSGRLLRTLSGHSKDVLSVAFSPEGQWIASGSADGTAKVWEVATGRLLQTVIGHRAGVNAVAFTPDGVRLVTGSDDMTAAVWDWRRELKLGTLSGHTGDIRSLALSPDGNRLVTGSGDATAKMWDLQTETILFTVRDPVKGGINSVAFAPDGRSFATASSNHIAEVWDAQTGTPQHQLQGHTDFVTSVAFSPDGSRIATSSADSTLRVWDARKGRELLTLGRNSGFINAVTFSPDGKRLVSTGRSTRVWDADSSRYEPAPPR